MRIQNPDIEKILEAKEKNQLVVFIGAGVSANSGLPSWSELVTEFAKKLGIDRSLNSEDYLRIPQYFFNERGQLEYNQVIEKVFSKQYVPNPLHDQILSLKPKHIITTNYDNLIEQSLEKHYLFYNNVFEDKDLPYASDNRLFIKMHGDLVKKNFVLKEDDYLNYSRNFRLIENYVESIFINHTVLFIGYSVQDYDLKLILKRIQSTLGDERRTAYLINSSSNITIFEKTYFKKFGINIIDSSCVLENPIENPIKNPIKNPYGAVTFNILEFINKYELDNKESITYFAKKWSSFKTVNAVRVKEMLDRLNLQILNYQYLFGELRIISYDSLNDDSIVLVKLIDELNNIKNDLSNNVKNNLEGDYNNIIDVLSKASIKQIIIGDPLNLNMKEFKLDLDQKNWKPEVLNYIENNNYVELNNMITKLSSRYPNFSYEDNLSLSYAYVHLNKFISANNQLQNISLRAYKEKKYSMYYLASFNKLVLARLLPSPGILMSGNLNEAISSEYIQKLDSKSIKKEVDESFKQFTSSESEELKFLENLLDPKGLLNDLRNQNKSLLESIKNDYTINWSHGSRPDNLDKLISNVHEFYRYTSYNLLIANYYSETKEIYKSYFEAICCTYPNELSKKTLLPYKLTQKDLIIVTNCLSLEEIKKILNKYNIKKLQLADDDTLFANMLLFNIISSYGYFINSKNIENKLSSTLELFKVFDFKIEELEGFIQQLNILINDRPIRDTVYISFFNFLSRQENSSKINPQLYVEFLQKYIEKLCNKEFNNQSGFEIDLLKKKRFIEFFFEVTTINKIKKINLNIEFLFKELDIGNLKFIKKEVYKLLINIAPLANDELIKTIKKKLKDYLKESFDSDVFLKIISLNILVPDKDAIYKFKHSLLAMNQYEIINFINHSNNKPQYIMKIIKNSSDLFSFLIDPNIYNYDKNNFDVTWINYLTEIKLRNLNSLSRNYLKNELFNEIIQNDYKNQHWNKIYLTYFA